MLLNQSVLIDDKFEQVYVDFLMDNLFTSGYWIVVAILSLLVIILYNPALGDSGIARVILGLAFTAVAIMIGLYFFISHFV